jgi:hypothetical protein
MAFRYEQGRAIVGAFVVNQQGQLLTGWPDDSGTGEMHHPPLPVVHHQLFLCRIAVNEAVGAP